MSELCHLCQRPARGGWCPPRVRPDCVYHARLRLGISPGWARKLRSDEWRALINERNRR